MPQLHWRLPALLSTLDDDTLLARPLLLSGNSCYAPNLRRLRGMLARRVIDVMKQIEPGELYRYLQAEMPEVRTLEIEVPPLREDVLRRHAVQLPLQYVVWRHGVDALIAYVPALGIEVLAESEQQLAELLEPQMKMALSRNRWVHSLRSLVHLSRYRELTVRPLSLKVNLPTLKEAAMERESEAAKEKSLLKEIATNLNVQSSRPVYERDAEVRRLAELLTRRSPRSVLLVGRSGVGKTALVEHLAAQRAEFNLTVTPFWSTSGSRIVAGMTGFGMWQDRCEKLVREASREKVILHLGNLVELIEVGKGGGNLQGVAAVLRPHIDRGAFLAIVECTPEQLAVIEREDPQLLETFTQFDLEPSSPEQTRAILQAVANQRRSNRRITPDALATLDRLHRRWATYSASPGRQLRFLRNMLDDQRRSRKDKREVAEITPSEVTAAFSQETGLPLFMLDDALPLDLARTQAWFSERVIGQSEAVQQTVDLLAAVKTSLALGGKPIASLLFIGPTGVGKTEMAKSLAEFLFQDRSRMIRFDMSEYSHPAAIERLIGGAYAAQGLLTQKVRDQPFTVVLLDEFEKAHPYFFDVLLQVLGEGRLTDGVGRVTDFTNSVVIMTSNLGAESYRRGAVGFAGEANAADFSERHFEREVKAFLRPEMFNRLDRIVPFAPLDRATIARIARREIDHVLAREGLRFRGVSLKLDDAVVDHLAQGGFDPRYGARPLKRAIERQLVAPLAEGLNRYGEGLRLDGAATLQGETVRVDITARPHGSLSDPESSITDAIDLVIGLRRHLQALQSSSILTRVRNEIERIRQEERALEKRMKKRGHHPRFAHTMQRSRMMNQEQLLTRLDTLLRDIVQLEDHSLSHFYTDQTIVAAEIKEHWSELDRAFRKLLFDLPQLEGGRRNCLSIAAYGESMETIAELLQLYEQICRREGARMRWFWLKMYREEYDETLAIPGRPIRVPPGPRPNFRLLSRQELEEQPRLKVIDVYNAPPTQTFEMPTSDCIGVAMEIDSERAAALLQTESGRHEFLRAGGGRDVCYVETLMERVLNYDPPRDVGRRGSMNHLALRRTYDLREEECRDELLRRTIPIRARRVDEALTKAVEEYLTVRLWELVEAWS